MSSKSLPLLNNSINLKNKSKKSNNLYTIVEMGIFLFSFVIFSLLLGFLHELGHLVVGKFIGIHHEGFYFRLGVMGLIVNPEEMLSLSHNSWLVFFSAGIIMNQLIIFGCVLFSQIKFNSLIGKVICDLGLIMALVQVPIYVYDFLLGKIGFASDFEYIMQKSMIVFYIMLGVAFINLIGIFIIILKGKSSARLYQLSHQILSKWGKIV
jgi:hypothetical protein